MDVNSIYVYVDIEEYTVTHSSERAFFIMFIYNNRDITLRHAYVHNCVVIGYRPCLMMVNLVCDSNV